MAHSLSGKIVDLVEVEGYLEVIGALAFKFYGCVAEDFCLLQMKLYAKAYGKWMPLPLPTPNPNSKESGLKIISVQAL